ncbi:MAG: glycosyltransferase family 4 protein [Panacagrimonas sp.]
MKRRVLMISHAHPDFSKGGAELAAHGLFRGLRRLPHWDAVLLARHGVAGLKRSAYPFVAHADENELLFDGGTDHFFFSARDDGSLLREFGRLLESLRPDAVHFHHYWQVGLELIRAVKRHDPNVPVVMTLHEYLAICRQNGQMVKTSGQLCTRGSPALCHACMPDRSPDDYFLRRHFIQSFFGEVDLFVAPSHFLRERYLAWGLRPDHVVVLENGQNQPPPTVAADATDSEAPRTRFAFFGQITPYKGVDVLLDAIALLPLRIRKQIRVEIHGGANDALSLEARARLDEQILKAGRCLKLFGPYAPEDQARLIGKVDWVVVPSIWWENSPMVIQEAFLHGRPVICADIGGMAEKVLHDHTGLHFRARNAADLARSIEQAATTPGLWNRLARNIVAPPSTEDSARAHVEHYERLIAASAQPTVPG